MSQNKKELQISISDFDKLEERFQMERKREQTNLNFGPWDGRKKRSRERGKDTKPRDYPLHTMRNLPQFRNKSHEEFRQYILETKGVDIGSNFNLGSLMLWILLVFAIVAGGIGIVKWLHQRQERKDNQNSRVTNTTNMF